MGEPRPTMHSMDEHVLGQIGLHVAGEDSPCGAGMHLHLDPVLLEDDGHLDFGVLGVFLDMACSQAGLNGPFVHADISIHRINRPVGERLHVEARQVRSGKRSAIVHVEARDETGVLVADSSQQVVVKGGPEAAAAFTDEMREEMRKRFMARFDGTCRLPGRLHDVIGLERVVTDDGPHWSMPISERSRNGFGGLHGGVAFDLVTEAAAGAAADQMGSVVAKSALLRYLAPALVGPFRATPVVMPQDDGSVHVRVEVADTGADDLLCILAEVHLAAPTP